MCGRYLLHADPYLIARAFGIDEFSELPPDLVPRFNVAPTQLVPIVRRRAADGPLTIVRRPGDGARELTAARWGLIPVWADDAAIGNRMINARAEGIAAKPAFRSAFKARRCVIPASGFYEWRKRGGPKRPYLIRPRDGALIGLAGLWETWTDRTTGEVVTSCAIITTAPNALMAELHDRMPVVLDPADYDAWLDPADPRGADLLRPCPDDLLEAVAISTRVNSPRNDDATIIQPEGEPLPAQRELI